MGGGARIWLAAAFLLLLLAAVAAACDGDGDGGDGAERPLRILFYSDRDGDDDVYIMNADGTDVRQLTDEPGRDYEGDASPDGRTIVFASQRDAADSSQLYLMDIDGANVRRLTFSTGNALEPARAVDDYAHWSPDGRHVVFQRTTIPAEGRPDADIWMIDVDSGEETQLTDTPDDWDSTPSFSPDGKAVLFESDRSGDYELYRMDLEAMEAVQLTREDGTDLGAKESPDGAWFLFSSDRDGDREVYLIAADGGEVRQLTDNEFSDHYPHWSPDGRLILFDSDRDGNREIYMMSADGSGQRRITSDPGKDADPHWVRPPED